MTEMTDAELIEASRNGDRDAYGAVVERHQRMVEAIAYAAAGDRAIVDDVVQDTFVSAWQQLDRLRDPARLRPWLCGIAMNVARKTRRRRRREADVTVEASGGETPFEAAAEHERAREVTNALAKLSPRYRDPLVLFYYEQCSVKEVAATLAIREDTAMQRLSRGRQQLGDVLAARVEESLERKPSRKAVAIAVLALLPLVRTRSSLAAVPHAVQKLVAVPARGVTATVGVLATRWRPAAALVATAAIAVIFVHGVRTSERIAAAQAAHGDHVLAPAPEEHVASRPEAPLPPQLPEDDGQIYGNISVASADPVETCRRGVHGLVSFVLDKHSLVVENGQTFYRPDPKVERMANDFADKISATCGGPWPELYVTCEGTMTNILDGTMTCYPYDPFE